MAACFLLVLFVHLLWTAVSAGTAGTQCSCSFHPCQSFTCPGVQGAHCRLSSTQCCVAEFTVNGKVVTGQCGVSPVVIQTAPVNPAPQPLPVAQPLVMPHPMPMMPMPMPMKMPVPMFMPPPLPMPIPMPIPRPVPILSPPLPVISKSVFPLVPAILPFPGGIGGPIIGGFGGGSLFGGGRLYKGGWGGRSRGKWVGRSRPIKRYHSSGKWKD